MIYFDNAATTRPLDSAVSAMNDALCDFGNPSSLHKLGLSASQRVSSARKSVAAALGALPEEIYFTSGATEADNTAIFGAANSLGKRKPRIVISSVEHPAVAEPCRHLEATGFEIVRVSPREDGFHAEDIINAVDEKTCIVSMMLYNNETGAPLPVSEVFRRIKKLHPDTLTHCDMVQGFLKVPCKAKKLFADMISLSGHKVHAPKGIGALYIKKGVTVPSMMFGGGQEKGFRSGTESVPLISAFGAAVDELSGDINERHTHAEALSQYLRERLSAESGFVFNSPPDGLPYINSISTVDLRSEVLLHYLEQRDIFVSSGSACSKGKKSSALREFHIPDDLADSTIRISFSAQSVKEEIDILVGALLDAKKDLLSTK